MRSSTSAERETPGWQSPAGVALSPNQAHQRLLTLPANIGQALQFLADAGSASLEVTGARAAARHDRSPAVLMALEDVEDFAQKFRSKPADRFHIHYRDAFLLIALILHSSLDARRFSPFPSGLREFTTQTARSCAWRAQWPPVRILAPKYARSAASSKLMVGTRRASDTAWVGG